MLRQHLGHDRVGLNILLQILGPSFSEPGDVGDTDLPEKVDRLSCGALPFGWTEIVESGVEAVGVGYLCPTLEKV